ncbi:MAG: cation diffusion facilitator family transporter [Capsulimonas sp.]|uniref:cation diffusion facilitator family transporter n=1 Tax=Capsulimonas sp. TaxID=2494211 RepID=UPI0032642076
MDIGQEAAPHGGMWTKTENGFVEISVFETGVPPQFRLYFFDNEKKPVMPPKDAAASLDTMRPEGVKQVFDFTNEVVYLKSTSDIPEPHEFNVVLKLSQNAREEIHEAKFTEESHGHSHDHGHSHGPEGHSHDHGGGLLGWFKGTFAHSHAAADKIDETMESNARGIWALKISLIGLLVTALLQLAVVIFSGSVALMADMIHNFGDATTSIPLWIAFALAARGASRRFTYGYGKVEDVAGVVIVLVIFASACVAAYESVMKIIHPHPMQHLWWVAAAAVVGFLGNEAVAVFRLRVGKEIGSAALVADGMHARVDGFTSLAVLIGVLGTYFGYPIVDPIVGVLITVAILFIVKDASIAVWNRLIEGIEPKILSEIEHAPMHVPGVQSVHQARARWHGHRVFADLHITVDPDLSVHDSHAITDAVQDALREHVASFGEAVVHVCPGERKALAA